ncbi:MAG: hypothetical protein GXC76_01195 [Rhodanobacteraceae bacterium]|jgi:hypothetical protein|nr:hypothetical protein [Rhodanobacteraceae bacterium]
MPMVRIRLNGSEDDASALMTAIHALDDIEHVEEIDDEMIAAEDLDSSSAGLSDDFVTGVHEIEIEAPHVFAAERVRKVAEAVADQLGVPIEIVDEF